MKIENSLGFNLGKIVQKMDQSFSEALSQYELNSRDYGILLTIFGSPFLTQLEIGERMTIDRTTIGQLIDDLEAKNLIQRQKNPKDRRQNLIILTERGQKITKEMWEIMRRIERDVIKHLNEEELNTVSTIIKIIEED